MTAPYITQILGSGTGTYFADQNNNPIIYLNDALWGLISNAGAYGGTWQNDIDTVINTRAAQGYTALLVGAIIDSHGGAQNNSGNTWDGVAPFTTAYTTLNNTYWTRVDYLINQAEAKGITILLNVVFTYALADSSNIMFGINSGSNPSDYGTALGNRYKTGFPNLIWMFGDDYDGTSFSSVFSGVISGIRSAGDTHMASIENIQTGSTSRYDISGPPTSPYSWGGTYASFNFCYYYAETYYVIEYSYTEPSPILTTWGDGMFWGEAAGGTAVNDQAYRMQNWWALSSGARGYGAGDNNVYPWSSTSAAALTGDGNWFTSWAGNIKAAVTSLPGWHQLVPDTSSTLVTGGRGTRASYNGSAGQGYVSSNTYVTASRTPDKKLALIYFPAHTTITINQAQMAAGYTATWIDPASGAKTSTATGSTYNSTPLGSNSAGDADWALALKAPGALPAGPALYGFRS